MVKSCSNKTLQIQTTLPIVEKTGKNRQIKINKFQ